MLSDFVKKHQILDRISEEEITALVNENLPAWKKACDDNKTEGIALHQDAFGNSIEEMILLGLAVKYAKSRKKEVRIIS